MRITYDFAKREKTLAERGLDFRDAAKVFAGATLTLLDDRRNYGEPRYQTYGFLARQFGDGGVDPARRGSPRDFHEEMQCP